MRHISETVQHEVFAGASEDAHGNVVDSWAAAVPLGIYAFDPGGSVEPALPGHDRVVTTPRLLLPSSAVVGARDRVTVRGKRFEVDGDPLDFRNPYDDSQDGLSVNLKAVTG